MDLENSLLDPQTAIQELARGRELTAELSSHLQEELARGRELTAELSSHLQEEFWLDEHGADDFCKGIMEAFEKGISLIVKSSDVTVPAESNGSPSAAAAEVHAYSESGDSQQQKKRRTCTYSKTTVTDSPFSDGYQWRKYGQKMIQNVKYPRSYYKCTHSDCDAKLLVEQIVHSSGSQPMYKVTHNNEHTCNTADPLSVFQTCSPTTPSWGSNLISFKSNRSVLASFDKGDNEQVHHFSSSSSSNQQIRDHSTAGMFRPRSSDTSSSWLQHQSVPDGYNILSPPLSPPGQFYDASTYV